MRQLKLYLAVILSGALTGCSQHLVSSPTESTHHPLEPVTAALQKTSNLTYSPKNWPQTLQGDIHRPDNNTTYPAVLLIHGGGWRGRSRQDTNNLAKEIAGSGYVVFNISHRFAPQHQFPEQIYDVQLALRWLRSNARSFKLNPDKIASWGYSSGAHLAAMLGAITSNDMIDQPHGGSDARVQAVVAGGTPADLRKYNKSPLVEGFLGVSHAEKLSTYEQASPAYYVQPGHPPVFLYHGRLDALVRLNQPVDYKEILDAAHVPNELYIRNFQGHATAFLFDGASVKKATQFLDRQLKQ